MTEIYGKSLILPALVRSPDGHFKIYGHEFFIHESSALNRDGRGQRLPEDWPHCPAHRAAWGPGGHCHLCCPQQSVCVPLPRIAHPSSSCLFPPSLPRDLRGWSPLPTSVFGSSPGPCLSPPKAPRGRKFLSLCPQGPPPRGVVPQLGSLCSWCCAVRCGVSPGSSVDFQYDGIRRRSLSEVTRFRRGHEGGASGRD